MATIGIHTAHQPRTASRPLADPVQQAYTVLRVGFTVAPIAFGLDKFVDLLVDWERYLAPELVDALPGSANQLLYVVGVVEVLAGVVVALRPRVGGYLVAAWLAGIIANLLVVGDYYDIALRDFGLLLGALALARLAAAPAPTHEAATVADRSPAACGTAPGRPRTA